MHHTVGVGSTKCTINSNLCKNGHREICSTCENAQHQLKSLQKRVAKSCLCMVDGYLAPTYPYKNKNMDIWYHSPLNHLHLTQSCSYVGFGGVKGTHKGGQNKGTHKGVKGTLKHTDPHKVIGKAIAPTQKTNRWTPVLFKENVLLFKISRQGHLIFR